MEEEACHACAVLSWPLIYPCDLGVRDAPLSVDIRADMLAWSQPELFILSLISPWAYFFPALCLSLPHTPPSYDGRAHGGPSGVAMVDTLLLICAFIPFLLHAVWRALVSEPGGLAGPHAGHSLLDFMEVSSERQRAVRQLKQQFVEALQANDAQQVLQILHSRKIDIDTVLEVEDPSMVLASYKQGETGCCAFFFHATSKS